jgi:hypothetical protein
VTFAAMPCGLCQKKLLKHLLDFERKALFYNGFGFCVGGIPAAPEKK